MDSNPTERPEERLLNPKRERCARCGEVAIGLAYIDGKRYCHEGAYPTCYMLESWKP